MAGKPSNKKYYWEYEKGSLLIRTPVSWQRLVSSPSRPKHAQIHATAKPPHPRNQGRQTKSANRGVTRQLESDFDVGFSRGCTISIFLKSIRAPLRRLNAHVTASVVLILPSARDSPASLVIASPITQSDMYNLYYGEVQTGTRVHRIYF